MTPIQHAPLRERFAKVAPAAGRATGAAGGFRRSRGNNDVQPNSIPASGFTVATVALPDGIVLGR